ncbi:MAG TPA: DUF481 domain-containing protein [Thermoanaerobaculaceae bacterium]|nr:DUF481 domain-containing protein [Thermoanaerobaculaceae bacterium]HRS17534.1 DUF481 domain-containing protein [Thermoanaerobaculaceae bacterium]
MRTTTLAALAVMVVASWGVTDEAGEPWTGSLGRSYLATSGNFDQSSLGIEAAVDWRLVSETALQAALSTRFALKIGLALRYDHQPPPGFRATDTATTASLVWSF